MTIHIDGAKAIELLELAVAERGADYVYEWPTCEYIVGQRPACIVGVALRGAGVPLSVLAGLGGNVQDAVLDPDLTPFVTLSAEALNAWSAAQTVQDGDIYRDHGTWGDALAAAKAALS